MSYVARTLLSLNRIMSETYPTRVSDTHVMRNFKNLPRVHVSRRFKCCRVRTK